MECSDLRQHGTEQKMLLVKNAFPSLNYQLSSLNFGFRDKPSSRSYIGTPQQIVYPGIECRRVITGGRISYAGSQYFISTALDGWDVGLTPVSEGRLDVQFAGLTLGQIEPSSAAFLPVIPFGKSAKNQKDGQ
jgi:hypothetical protein